MSDQRDTRVAREMSVGEFREQFAEALNEVKYGKGRTVVKRHGKRVVAVISIDDLELLERVEEILDRNAIRQAEDDIEVHGTVNWEDALHKLGVDKDELRNKNDSPRTKNARKARQKAPR